jgi:hypothetical protein
MANVARKLVDFDTVHDFLAELFHTDVHARRVYSLANATLGVMTSASLAVHTIGQALAQARGLAPKHAVKQVDRLLSNGSLQVWALFEHWVPYVVGARSEIVVALDWTDFADDDQATIALHLVTGPCVIYGPPRVCKGRGRSGHEGISCGHISGFC